jgi:hypothetical protein
MLNKITISILLCLPLVGIPTSYANQAPVIEATIQSSNNNALRLNSKYVNIMKTPNVVLNETYKLYVNDFETRYQNTKKSLDEYNKTQDLKLKPLNLKIDQIIKSFDEEASDAYLSNLINTEVNNFSSTIKTVTKNRLNNQETLIGTNFPDESKVFLKQFQTVLKDYDVTKEEKEYLEKTVKEFIVVMKNNPINSSPDKYKASLEVVSQTPSAYTYVESYQKALIEEPLAKYDKALFDVIWSKARSNSVYPTQKK